MSEYDDDEEKKVYRRALDSKTDPETLITEQYLECGHVLFQEYGDILEHEDINGREMLRCVLCEKARSERRNAAETRMSGEAV